MLCRTPSPPNLASHPPYLIPSQLRLHEFAQEDVDAAVAAHWEPGDSAADLSKLSPEARKALRGGLLSLRVLRVSGQLPAGLGGRGGELEACLCACHPACRAEW